MLQRAKFLEVDAGVRYWEDGRLNGQVDSEGRMPLRNGDGWQPVIELATGRVLSWPEGAEAELCYKVCDAGFYWLLDESHNRIAKWKRSYVPRAFLDTKDSGLVSDYIVLEIGADGVIKSWRQPEVVDEQWVPI